MIFEKNNEVYEIIFYNKDDEIVNDEFITLHEIDKTILKEIEGIINITGTVNNFIDYYEIIIDDIIYNEDVNNDNIKRIDEIEDKLLKIYLTLKNNDLKTFKIQRRFYIKSTVLNTSDLIYFLKYKINSLKEKKFKSLYLLNKTYEILKDFFNVDEDIDVDDLLKIFNIEIIKDDNLYYYNVRFNNKIYALNYYSFNKYNLNDLKIDLFNYYYYQFNNKLFEYFIILFDDININSLSYFYNIYSNSYNLLDDDYIDDTIIYEDYNVDLLDEYNINIYSLSNYDEDDYNNLLNEIYDKLFNEIIFDYNDDIIYEDNDDVVIYGNKILLINKDFLKKLNNKYDNEIYYYSAFDKIYNNQHNYKIDYNKLFEILLKQVNKDINNYYDLIEIVDEFKFNNYDVVIDDFNKSKYNIKIDNDVDLYFYVKYHYNLNIKKDELILKYACI